MPQIGNSAWNLSDDCTNYSSIFNNNLNDGPEIELCSVTLSTATKQGTLNSPVHVDNTTYSASSTRARKKRLEPSPPLSTSSSSSSDQEQRVNSSTDKKPRFFDDRPTRPSSCSSSPLVAKSPIFMANRFNYNNGKTYDYHDLTNISSKTKISNALIGSKVTEFTVASEMSPSLFSPCSTMQHDNSELGFTTTSRAIHGNGMRACSIHDEYQDVSVPLSSSPINFNTDINTGAERLTPELTKGTVATTKIGMPQKTLLKPITDGISKSCHDIKMINSRAYSQECTHDIDEYNDKGRDNTNEESSRDKLLSTQEQLLVKREKKKISLTKEQVTSQLTQTHSFSHGNCRHRNHSSSGNLVLSGPPGKERWRAHRIAEDYISVVNNMMLPGTYLGPFGYDPASGQYPVESITALAVLLSPMRRPIVVEKWSPFEISMFQASLAIYGKEFHQIQHFVQTKSTKEIVEFYYIWKKTDHYKVWKQDFVHPNLNGSSDDEE